MGIETAIGIISAVAAAASAAGGIKSMVGGGGGGGGKMPTPTPIDTTQLSRALMPGARANAAASVGGGFSPDFLGALVGQQSGQPGAGTDILEEIRQSMGPQAL